MIPFIYGATYGPDWWETLREEEIPGTHCDAVDEGGTGLRCELTQGRHYHHRASWGDHDCFQVRWKA